MRAIVTVVGHDKVGIIAEVCTLLSKNNVNILDINQTILQEFFTMTMLVDVSKSAIPFADLKAALAEKGGDMSLKIRIQSEEIFEAMHRI